MAPGDLVGQKGWNADYWEHIYIAAKVTQVSDVANRLLGFGLWSRLTVNTLFT
jgi:hypothetical protein